MNIQAAADRLGVSPTTVRRMIHERHILHAWRVGCRIVITDGDLKAFVREHCDELNPGAGRRGAGSGGRRGPAGAGRRSAEGGANSRPALSDLAREGERVCIAVNRRDLEKRYPGMFEDER